MAGHLTYEESKKLVLYGLKLLGAITLIEVFIALAAKGHIPGIPNFYENSIGRVFYILTMVGFSVYKAYFIVFFFMHMAFELRGLVLSVLMPTLLLVWAIIAFINEGTAWGARREQIHEKDRQKVETSATPPKTGSLYVLPIGQTI